MSGSCQRREPATPRTTPDPSGAVAIIGGGVIGLSIGWRLAQAGLNVTVFERGKAGHGASWAAAGMLAAGLEAEPGEEALLALNRESQAMWPRFAAELEAAAGMTIGLKSEGTLMVALNRDDLARLRFSYDFLRGLGVEIDWLTIGDARTLEPHVIPNLAGAMRRREDHQVDNRLLVPALARAFIAAGGALREDTPVAAIETAAGRVVGLHANGESHRAGTVVLAAGAWSNTIDGIAPERRPPVRPVKGQMLALRMDAKAPLLRHVVWAPKSYLVPRGDGRLLIGGTVEERGFDADLTAGGVLAILEGAWRAVPGIEELPIAELWTGHRPGSRDDAPILGDSGLPGLVLATGHYRNGILLTPVTARAVAHLILTGETEPAIRPFGRNRFAAPAEARS
ncbi:MAG: glycine oxidase ThiO [Stellaceae bacterium]